VACTIAFSCRNAIPDRAKKTLAEILKQLTLEPLRYERLQTVSTSNTQVVCSATLPLPDGGASQWITVFIGRVARPTSDIW